MTTRRSQNIKKSIISYYKDRKISYNKFKINSYYVKFQINYDNYNNNVPLCTCINYNADIFCEHVFYVLLFKYKVNIKNKILKKNLSIRHNVPPTHSLSELLYLKELFPDRIILFGAYLKNEMIAGVINFVVNDRIVLAFYISHKKQYQELRPINLLFYKIFDWAICNKFKVFDFGIFTVHEKPNMGLARFKENFGASGVFRDTVELTVS